jgi:hypothetical protein
MRDMIQRLRQITSVFLPAILIVAAATQCAGASRGAEKSDSASEPLPQKIEWLGVEVVTDNPKLAADIRSKIPLAPHTVLDFPSEDVGYKRWCDAVRATYPAALTSCSPVLMDGAKAYYIVQVEFAPKQVVGRKTCDPSAPKLPQSLWALSTRFMELLQVSLMENAHAGIPYREFINDQGVLDYTIPSMHEFSQSAHEEVRAHLREVVASTNSCDAAERRASIGLMNWSGDITASLEAGSKGILDEDGGVRNESTRLLVVFMGNLGDSVPTVPLVRALCTQLGYTSFTDRNKAASALLALADKHPSSRPAIRNTCGTLVRQRAFDGQSISPQIQGAATNLVSLLEGKH